MSITQFRLAARTDAAGKYNAEAPLEGNEDNYFIDNDLTNEIQSQFTADKIVDLSDKGCLMVVADGMGGMNAGEVASEIAIKTVTEYFKPEQLKDKSFRDSRARIKYLEDVVVAADAAIKSDSRTNKNHEGMGSTIIMAWLCDNEICLTWCGDSRAYLYRPHRGFWQVSKDHSYVQGLVDEGKITMDEAFDHPYGNIITRSLGDPEKKAKPDSVNFDVYEGDVFMLCSDGLSGVLRDHKTYMNGQRVDSENLEDIISANLNSMAQCRDALFDAAQRNEWYDNVTVILCEITKGVPQPSDMPQSERQEGSAVSPLQNPNPVQNLGNGHTGKRKPRRILLVIIAAAVVLLGAICFVIWKTANNDKPSDDDKAYELCQKSNNVDDYRYYQRNYPNGTHIDSVNAWLFRDSVKRALPMETKKTDETEGKQSVKQTSNLQNGNDNNARGNSNTTETNHSNTGNEAPYPTISNPIESDSNIYKPTDNEVNIASGTSGAVSNLKPASNSDTNIKEEVKLKSEGLTPNLPKNEEEAFEKAKMSEIIEPCLYYLETYNQVTYQEHRNIIQYQFIKLYKKKLNSCDTYEKCVLFLEEHDEIMKRAKMKGEQFEIAIKTQAEEKMKQLNPNNVKNGSTNNTGTTKSKSVKASSLK